MMTKPILFVAGIALLFTSCSDCSSKSPKKSSPKNVILLIGDGTGLSQISSAFYYKDSEVNYSRFNHIGLIRTSSSQEDVTDSAAGATAFACGEKTYNGAVGVANDQSHITNLTEILEPLGVKTGLVATSSITHATPAGFYAHAQHRDMKEIIAKQLVESSVDFFAGGGLEFFSNRSDSLDLIKELTAKGFSVDTLGLTSLETISTHSKQGYLLAPDGMPKMLESRGDFLSEATLLGIEFLHQNDTPFFVMTEGSQIDWGGHANDSDYLISELIDFDNTIGKVLDFAERDGETLVIVTADHETGGFTLAGQTVINEQGLAYSDYSKIEPLFSTKGHSATLIPVFAYGPGAEAFSGFYENTDIFHKILKVTGWDSGKNP